MSELKQSVAIGYARVSTDEQAREGVSLNQQVTRIRAYAEAKGLTILDVLVDDGVSGKTMDRPGLREIMRLCEQGEVAHVIVLKLDRLTRQTRHLLSLTEVLFLARKVELHSVSESLDTSSPHGRFVLTLFGGLAQMEREQIAERTRSAMAYKRQLKQPTSHPPLGFQANGSKERMVSVPEELAVVRRVLETWRRGSSYGRIAAAMNAEAVPTKRGARWYPSTVRAIVRRRAWYLDVLGAI